MSDARRWTTPSELAEHTFCPRAQFYRRHSEAPPSEATNAGEAYHLRRLSSERWREEHSRAAWLTVAVGAGFLAIAVAVLVL